MTQKVVTAASVVFEDWIIWNPCMSSCATIDVV